MRRKTILRSFLSVIPLIGMGFLFNSHEHDTHTYAQINRAVEPAYDFSDQVEVGPDQELSVSVLSSTTTPTSQSFGISFKTGGIGYKTRKNSFIVTTSDEQFYEYVKELDSLSVDDRKKLEDDIKNGIKEAPEFSGYVTQIKNGNSGGHVVIPKKFTRNELLYLHIESVDLVAVENWKNIKSITIPNTVKNVYDTSFAGAPAGTIFNIEDEEAVPVGWDENWLPEGCILNKGYDYDGNTDDKTKVPSQYGNPVQFGDPDKNYILGYYPEDGEKYPLVLGYEFEGQPGEVHYHEFNLNTRSNSNYDSVGQNISNTVTNLFITIPLNGNNKINVETLTIYNIYPQTSVGNVIVPDVINYKGYFIKPDLTFSHQYDLDEFFKYSYSRVSSFANYIAVAMNVDTVIEPTIYSTLNNNYYENNLPNIEKGHTIIRYRFTNLSSASYKIVYEGRNGLVTKVLPVSTPISYYNFSTTSTNNVVFLIDKNTIGDDFSLSNLHRFDLESASITLDLYIPERNAIIARSNVTTRFGNISIYNSETQPSLHLFNVDLFLILLAVGFIVIYSAVATIIFYVRKEKYKNDEFRRVKPAKFLQKALIGLFGLGIIVFAIAFVVLRVTVLSNSVVVFNPTDPFIIVFGIASVLSIGYFVKELIAYVKAEKQRKTAIRLQLDKDVDDDGTH